MTYVTCDFASAVIDAKVVFDAEGRVTGLWFGLPQPKTGEYKEPPYSVAGSLPRCLLESGKEPWVLPGTLSPPAKGHFRQSCWSTDRGQRQGRSIGPNKPFRDLAHGGEQGDRVLPLRETHQAVRRGATRARWTRLLSRGEGRGRRSGGRGVLRQVEKVDPDRVFVLGHSSRKLFGAEDCRDCSSGATGEYPAGLIMMAPNARPLPT